MKMFSPMFLFCFHMRNGKARQEHERFQSDVAVTRNRTSTHATFKHTYLVCGYRGVFLGNQEFCGAKRCHNEFHVSANAIKFTAKFFSVFIHLRTGTGYERMSCASPTT